MFSQHLVCEHRATYYLNDILLEYADQGVRAVALFKPSSPTSPFNNLYKWENSTRLVVLSVKCVLMQLQYYSYNRLLN